MPAPSLLEGSEPGASVPGSVTFWVAGEVVQQGSMKAFVVGGRPRVTHTNSAGLNAWRGNIASEARSRFYTVSTGPIELRAEFVLKRPLSQPKMKEKPHLSYPDIDKLLRSTLDALKGVAYADDKQVVEVSASKRYARVGEQTGVRLTITG